MANKTSIAMMATALMLAAAFVIATDENSAGDIENADNEIEVDKIVYTITSEDPKTVTLTGNKLDSQTSLLTVPEKVMDKDSGEYYTVTAIGDNAFDRCTLFTKITLPNSVKSIGNNAFTDCTSLTEMIIPDSVTSIGMFAFSYCDSLGTVKIGKGVESISNDAFWICSSLTSFEVDEDNTHYCSEGGVLFVEQENSPITLLQYPIGNERDSYEIPNGVTAIGDWAFDDCDSLTSIIIPDGVKSIGKGAFYGCTSLEKITISDSVEFIDARAFEECTSLKSIDVKGKTDYYSENGVLFKIGEDGTITLVQYPIGNERDSYEIPNGVTAIGGSAMASNVSLTSVKIPDSVTTIDGNAFYKCSSIKTIKMGSGVANIGSNAFYECSSLSEITIPDSVVSINSMTFNGCTLLKTITIGSGVTTINNFVFGGCTSLEILKIGACNISSCGSSINAGLLKYICIAEGATGDGLNNLLKNYHFFDSDGEEITGDWSKIAGQNYKVGEDGNMHYYDGPLPGPEPENNDPAGPNIGLIIGIIVAIVAVVGVGAYFFVKSKKH